MKLLLDNMEYKIYSSKKSRKMLNKHMLFLSQVSLRATINLKENIKNYISKLRFFPRIGSKVFFKGDQPTKYRKLVINKRYILIYFIKNNNIYIETILDSRQKDSYY